MFCYPKQPVIVINRVHVYWTVVAVTEATDTMNNQQELIADLDRILFLPTHMKMLRLSAVWL